MKHTNVLAGVCLVVLIGVIVVWGVRDGNEFDDIPLTDTGMVLYWGDGCPHCQNVEDYIQEKQIEGKVPFERKEIWKDRANAKEMERRAKNCGMSTQDIGVPFLFSDGKCFIGEPDVEKELSKRAGISEDAVNQEASSENK